MLRVRTATSADIPRMMEIARHSATAAQWAQRQYEEVFSPNRLAMAIEENSTVLGFIVGREAAGDWEIENIAVTGAARRRGLASRLLGEFLHQIRCSGAEEVFLEVRESNHAARKLYEKWAFTEAGRRKSYYQNPPEDALVLKFYFSAGAEI